MRLRRRLCAWRIDKYSVKNARLVWPAVYLLDAHPPPPRYGIPPYLIAEGLREGLVPFSYLVHTVCIPSIQFPRPHAARTLIHKGSSRFASFGRSYSFPAFISCVHFPRSFPAPFQAQFIEKRRSKKVAARGMPAAQAGIAVTAPPSSHPTVTEYKYEEVAEIIGKLGKDFWASDFSRLRGIGARKGLTGKSCTQ
jgi:hypothetical protein